MPHPHNIPMSFNTYYEAKKALVATVHVMQSQYPHISKQLTQSLIAIGEQPAFTGDHRRVFKWFYDQYIDLSNISCKGDEGFINSYWYQYMPFSQPPSEFLRNHIKSQYPLLRKFLDNLHYDFAAVLLFA